MIFADKVILSILLISNIFAIELSIGQKAIKELVLSESKKHTRYKSTIAAICFTESSLGINILGDDKRSLGIAQMQVKTVRYISSKDNSLAYLNGYTDKRIETMLLTNNRLAVELASKLFEYYRKRYGYFGAISRYNGGRKNYRYYKKVIDNRKMLNGTK